MEAIESIQEQDVNDDATISPELDKATATTYQLPSAEELKKARISEWKQALQAELSDLVQKASDIRKKVNEAKTAYKKQYYDKKFQKIQPKVMQMLTTLQHIEAQEQAEQAKKTAETPETESLSEENEVATLPEQKE